MQEYQPGDRVFVQHENSLATVIFDNGFSEEDNLGKRWDFGVVVEVDSDGAEVSAAHRQVERT